MVKNRVVITIETLYLEKQKVYIKAAEYQSNSASALVAETEGGEPLLKLSVNVEGISNFLDKDCFVCKSYGENEGLADALLASGFCVETNRVVELGYSLYCPIMRVKPVYCKDLGIGDYYGT
jgi:hypothetical protein